MGEMLVDRSTGIQPDPLVSAKDTIILALIIWGCIASFQHWAGKKSNKKAGKRMHGWLIGFAVAIGGTTMKCCKLVALAPHIAPRFIEISWLGSTRTDSYIRRTDMTSVGSYIGENNCCQIENLIKSKCPQLPNLRSGFHEPRNLDICIHLIANKLFYNQGICGFNRQKRMVTSAWVAWDDLSLSVFPVRVSCSKNLPAFVRCSLFSDKYICDMFNIQKKTRVQNCKCNISWEHQACK